MKLSIDWARMEREAAAANERLIKAVAKDLHARAAKAIEPTPNEAWYHRNRIAGRLIERETAFRERMEHDA